MYYCEVDMSLYGRPMAPQVPDIVREDHKFTGTEVISGKVGMCEGSITMRSSLCAGATSFGLHAGHCAIALQMQRGIEGIGGFRTCSSDEVCTQSRS